ncbi:inositol polyphosphate multikinase beta-like [Benincasa hispida]|uniref:inositol polyphosphate multikinase beta-like n=1 Tax=Benincasa hispida TaxID=102211 RepID=UPI0019004302|nr:inositol polyphosphate multikinase beta-like [Benincasa hispida]
MFKIPDHQVAGHQASDGSMGPLVDDSGLFFKPLQKDERGSKEVAFYKSLSSNTKVPDNIRAFFPAFHGTQDIPASDGSGLHPHLVLQDLISNYQNPSIVDIKIGSRTWYPQASEEYIQRCFKKDRETSSLALGFRLSGLQIHVSQKAGYWKPGRKFLQNSSAEKVKIILKKFVSSNASADSDVDDLDCVFASSIYGGANGILAQLLELKTWFEDQKFYHFYSSSVLMVYDKESMLETKSNAAIKLVDFAHVVDSNGVIDHNFLGGLCSLIKFISEILTDHLDCLNKTCLPCSDNSLNCNRDDSDR